MIQHDMWWSIKLSKIFWIQFNAIVKFLNLDNKKICNSDLETIYSCIDVFAYIDIGFETSIVIKWNYNSFFFLKNAAK